MAKEVSGEQRVTLGGDKGYDQKKLVGGAAARKRDTARGAEREAAWWQRDRWTHGAARWL
jgi:hypothetical protein